MERSSKVSKELNLADGPVLSDTELGVHIIYMPVERDVPQSSPTDIVVFDGKPWHLAGLPGHKKERREHPQVHIDFPDTILVISIENQQSAVWWSEEPFTITSIKRSGLDHKNRWYPEAPEADRKAPIYPFADDPPAPPTRNENGLYVARSTVPVAGSNGHMYKIKFTMAGKSIDPDMYCGAP
jgi:hypothetical protein